MRDALPTFRTALRRPAVVLCAAAALLAGASTAAAASVTSAAPTTDAGDGRTPRGFAVSFSPDGDGVRDRVVLRVRAAPGTAWRIVVTAAATEGTQRVVARGPVVRASSGGFTVLRWDGRGSVGVLSDGPYVLRACHPDGTCARQEVAAHLRVLAASIRRTGSFAAGALVPLRIDADRPSLIAGIAPDDVEPGQPLIGAAVLGTGRTAFRLPTGLAPGVYRLVVTSGRPGGWRALPLVVHSPRLLRPAPRTTLVVLPQLTWSVYNEFDADRDGRPDSHYESPSSPDTQLLAPYETAGLPAPGQAGREQDASHTVGFSRTWRLLGGPARLPADFATDLDVATMPPAALRRYAAVLFVGHTEYYTRALFRRIRGYQLHGGDFMYASANGFYALVARRGRTVHLISRPQRTAGLNDAMITGVQYSGCCWSVGSPGPLRVTRAGLAAAPWVFAGTGLRAGDVLAYAGGEIDGIGPQAPRGLLRLAVIDWRAPDPPESAAMAIVLRPGGGRVFAAGTMGFIGGTARNAKLRRVFGNVWAAFARR